MVDLRLPEHPEDVRARRRTVLSFVFAIAAICAAAGTVLVALSLATQGWWMDAPVPESVQSAIWSEYQVGLIMIGFGLSAMVCTWAWTRELRPARR